MSEPGSILCVEHVTAVDEDGGGTLWDASLVLEPGQSCIVNPGPVGRPSPLADVCMGLTTATAGTIRYLGHAWAELSPEEAGAARGTIGRVFDDGGWIHNLDVRENILLRVLHHSRQSADEVLEEAEGLARSFGLAALPRGSVAATPSADLHRAACVRAFMGAPRLVILEEPLRGLHPSVLGPLLGAVRGCLDRGGAALWISAETELWADETMRWDRRYYQAGTQLVEVAAPGRGGMP